MHKTTTTVAIVFLIWLVLDALHAPDILMNFILVGAVPGSSSASLSPTMMLAIMTTCAGLIIFELLARRFDVFRRIRYHFTHLIAKQERLPKRRFGRV